MIPEPFGLTEVKTILTQEKLPCVAGSEQATIKTTVNA
jgi:hypothetical protein